ncbi:MAG TPA: di-heme oxidoredictase family protein [Thermoanaerobaculia bacterium]|nr:di-heme oxidoredictase family protein [Thermoanaerobaculia bacterium]
MTLLVGVPLVYAAVDAPTGFDNGTNGFESQTNFDLDRAQFEAREEIPDGLGPVYNAQACTECHQNPVSGSSTQVNELRAGQNNHGLFADHPGGSLINDRAIDPSIQEHVFDSDNARAFRTSLNILGDGFVEALPDSEFLRVQTAQPTGVKGRIVSVNVLEASTGPFSQRNPRIARFGWKNQHSSLLSFSADAYLNEMGITSPIFPNENTSNGNSVAAFDTVADPEDAATGANPFGPDVEAFTRFMRSTKAPSRGPLPSDDIGEKVFTDIGCETCHTNSLTTAPTGTSFNGGFFVVPAALGDKIIHPYGDFMLHEIGTGDGISQGKANTEEIRTAPLWGLRTRTRLMHDGQSLTIRDAILRHGGQATASVTNFNALSATDSAKLFEFLNSL